MNLFTPRVASEEPAGGKIHYIIALWIGKNHRDQLSYCDFMVNRADEITLNSWAPSSDYVVLFSLLGSLGCRIFFYSCKPVKSYTYLCYPLLIHSKFRNPVGIIWKLFNEKRLSTLGSSYGRMKVFLGIVSHHHQRILHPQCLKITYAEFFPFLCSYLDSRVCLLKFQLGIA